MKKLNNEQMENLQGGLADYWSGAAGAVCTLGAVSGPIGWIMLGPSCGALIAISIWG